MHILVLSENVIRKDTQADASQAHTLCYLQEEREEKLHMVEFYNDRLTEREKRRDFLRARGLLSVKRMQVGVVLHPQSAPV